MYVRDGGKRGTRVGVQKILTRAVLGGAGGAPPEDSGAYPIHGCSVSSLVNGREGRSTSAVDSVAVCKVRARTGERWEVEEQLV